MIRNVAKWSAEASNQKAASIFTSWETEYTQLLPADLGAKGRFDGFNGFRSRRDRDISCFGKKGVIYKTV